VTTVSLHRGVREVPKATWDQLTSDLDLPSQYSFVAMRESLSSPGLVFVAEDDGGERAAVYAVPMSRDEGYARPARMLVSLDGLRLRQEPEALRPFLERWGVTAGDPEKAIAELRERFVELLYPTVAIFTPLETRAMLPDATPPADARALVEQLVDEVVAQVDADSGNSVMVLGTPSENDVLADECQRRGWPSALMGMAARLDLHGVHDLEQFRATLPKKKRYRVAKEAADFEALGLRIERLDPLESAELCAALEAQVMAKYGVDKSVDQLAKTRIAEAKWLEDALEAYGCFEGDKLIASITVYASKRRYTVGMYGADHDAIGDRPVYTQLVFHVPLERALAAGSQELCLGFESYRAKLNRGAVLDGRSVHIGATRPEGQRFAAEFLALSDARNREFFAAYVETSRVS
jgi:hypothetical protein